MTAADLQAQVQEFWAGDGPAGVNAAQQRVVLHGLETHGSCVLARGSVRTFREGGFVDVQPSWAYFFREGRLVGTAGYQSRAQALAAISRFNAEG
jgi:hypothetical protein